VVGRNPASHSFSQTLFAIAQVIVNKKAKSWWLITTLFHFAQLFSNYLLKESVPIVDSLYPFPESL